jgi:hypothetical protein
MRVPEDKRTGVFEQYDGYFDMPHIDVRSIPPSQFPMYLHWAYVRIFRYDMIKQPDVLLLLFFFSADYTDRQKKVNYEYYDKTLAQYQKHTVGYWRDGGSSSLIRQLTVNDVASPQETLLENVENLNFTYGVDVNEDGALDNWVPAGSIGISKVVAVRVTLTARPVQINPDHNKMISPRTLVSNVTLRNLCMIR